MKSGAIAVLAKTPGLSNLNPTLAQSIGKDLTERFYWHAYGAIESTLRELQAKQLHQPVEIYWAVAEPAGLKSPYWKSFAAWPQCEGKWGARLANLYTRLLEKHDFAILLQPECPQISVEILIEAIAALDGNPRFVMGGCEAGGFYLVGGNAVILPDVWTSVPYGDWQTAELLAACLSATAPVKRLTTLFDVSSMDELSRLRSLMVRKNDRSPENKALCKWIGSIL